MKCVLLRTATATMGALGALASPAVAASTSQIGRNVGNEVDSWAKALLLGIAGLVAIPVLAKRDVSAGIVLAILVVIVGGFVFAPTTVEHAITGVWNAIGG